jgi:hypothetical protein
LQQELSIHLIAKPYDVPHELVEILSAAAMIHVRHAQGELAANTHS